MAIDLTQEIDRHSTTVTEDTYVTTYLFQRLSVSLQFPSEILHLPSNTPLQLLTFFIFNIWCWRAENMVSSQLRGGGHRSPTQFMSQAARSFVLCAFVCMQCEPTVLPEPNHVMLNHLYALSIKVWSHQKFGRLKMWEWKMWCGQNCEVWKRGSTWWGWKMQDWKNRKPSVFTQLYSWCTYAYTNPTTLRYSKVLSYAFLCYESRTNFFWANVRTIRIAAGLISFYKVLGDDIC